MGHVGLIGNGMARHSKRGGQLVHHRSGGRTGLGTLEITKMAQRGCRRPDPRGQHRTSDKDFQHMAQSPAGSWVGLPDLQDVVGSQSPRPFQRTKRKGPSSPCKPGQPLCKSSHVTKGQGRRGSWSSVLGDGRLPSRILAARIPLGSTC